MITDKQRSFLFDLVCTNKDFLSSMNQNVWDADYLDAIKFLRSKFPNMTIPDDINDLSSYEASFLISSLKNV